MVSFLFSCVGAVSLSSEVSGHHNLCFGDRLVYTCTTSDGVLSWNVGETDLGLYVANLDDPGLTWTSANLPGIETVLTAENGMMLTSTLTIPSAGSVVANESTISCSDLGGSVNRSVLRVVGEYACYNSPKRFLSVNLKLLNGIYFSTKMLQM